MPRCIVHLFEPLLRPSPAPGHHRRTDRHSVSPGVTASAECPPRVLAAPVLRGEASGLVRSYSVVHEQRERQRRRTPRRALRPAVHGIGLGPRLFNSVEVRAR
ncbi:hypothetical protein ACFV1C_09605 [Streptomyces sp. NPDC059605]|uniref:hypothetical protein n=1 Tax=unclassified Streptomyces TaxID=2593676 RepID=UPI00367FB08B